MPEGRRSPETLEILKYLSAPERFGQWVSREEMTLAVMPKIAPGRAERHYTIRKESTSKKNTTDYKRPEIDIEEKHKSGRRSLVNASIGNLIRFKHIEMTQGPDQQIRLNVCLECGRPFRPSTQESPAPVSAMTNSGTPSQSETTYSVSSQGTPRLVGANVIYPDFPQWSRQTAG